MATPINAIYLGSLPALDPTEGNTVAENSMSLVGQTFGGPTDVLESTLNIVTVDIADPVNFWYDNTRSDSTGRIQIDGGGFQNIDFLVEYNATFTYRDGTTEDLTISVAQDVAGNTILLPSTERADGTRSTSQQTLYDAATSNLIESVAINSVARDNRNGSNWRFYEADDYQPVCFTRGVQITTVANAVVVEDLQVGDLVLTMNHGLQPIRWIGSCHVSADRLRQNPDLRPIRIRAGALGKGLPETDLLVSPQHRVLVRSPVAQRMFGTCEVLIAAKKLLPLDGIELDEDCAEVAYWHVLFDQHEVIYSNGAPTESLFTGPEALKSVGPKARVEIEALFPEICDPQFHPASACDIPKGALAKTLVRRHQKNGMPLLAV